MLAAHTVAPIAAATLPAAVDAEATPHASKTVAAIRAARTNVKLRARHPLEEDAERFSVFRKLHERLRFAMSSHRRYRRFPHRA